MAKEPLLGVATTAKIDTHPIHPMLVPFPIALLITTLASDIAFWASGSPFFAEASLWLLGAALVMGALAALAGFTDFFGNPAIREIPAAWHHMIGNLAAVILSLVNFAVRLGSGAVEGALPWGLVLSLLVVLILFYTGWKGGTLVFEHRVGMQPEAPAGRGPAVPPR
jgi:uncharacterized membrane protein